MTDFRNILAIFSKLSGVSEAKTSAKKFLTEGKPKEKGEYYSEYDTDSGLHCVFHTDKGNGKAYASYSSAAEAKAAADKKNKKTDESNEKTSRLKEIFEALAVGQKPMPVIGKVGDTQKAGTGFLNINDPSPSGQAMQKAMGDMAASGKAQIVMPNSQAPRPGTQMGQPTQATQSPQNANQPVNSQQKVATVQPTTQVTGKASDAGYPKTSGATANGGGASNNLMREEDHEDIGGSDNGDDALEQIKALLGNDTAEEGPKVEDHDILGKIRDIIASDDGSEDTTIEEPKEVEMEVDEESVPQYMNEKSKDKTKSKYTSSRAEDNVNHIHIHHNGEKIGSVVKNHNGKYQVKMNGSSMKGMTHHANAKDAAKEVIDRHKKKSTVDEAQSSLPPGIKDKLHKVVQDNLSSGASYLTNRIMDLLAVELTKPLEEADIPSSQVDMGAGLGAGRSETTLETKKPAQVASKTNWKPSDKKPEAKKASPLPKADEKQTKAGWNNIPVKENETTLEGQKSAKRKNMDRRKGIPKEFQTNYDAKPKREHKNGKMVSIYPTYGETDKEKVNTNKKKADK